MSIYFLRHGESKSNEQNRFAGLFDSPLTELGQRQALKAAMELKRLNIPIDEVHVSSLSRAKKTADLILEQLDSQSSIPVMVTESLLERDFGRLSEQNKSLIKKAYGHAQYENMFHRAGGELPNGESFQSMYLRTRSYYLNVLKPASESGKTILIVAHKYIVEMFALIAADLPPESYFDFKIPNSKPSTFAELGAYAKSASPMAQASAEIVEIYLSKFLLIAFLVGAVLKQMIGTQGLPTLFFNVITGFLLAINSFFCVLRLESSVIKNSFQALRDSYLGVVIRMGTGLAILYCFQNPMGLISGIYFMLPPAMTAPTLSLMWGGDYFFSAKLTGALSVVSIGALFLSSKWIAYFHSPFELHFSNFCFIFLVSVILPGMFAQAFRKKSPIQAGALATNQGWVGGAALIPLACASSYFLIPVWNHSFWMSEKPRLMNEWIALFAVLLLSQAIAYFAAKKAKANHQSKFDIYICQIFPNIFLLNSILPATAHLGLFLPLLNFAFFVNACLEEAKVVAAFAEALNCPIKPKISKGVMMLFSKYFAFSSLLLLICMQGFASTCASPKGNVCGAICVAGDTLNVEDADRLVIRPPAQAALGEGYLPSFKRDFVKFENNVVVDEGTCTGDITGPSAAIDHAVCTGAHLHLVVGVNSEADINLTPAKLTDVETGAKLKLNCTNISINLEDFDGLSF